jgi:glyoxalase family protein
MNTQLRTKGIHHITAVASSAVENLDFYRNVLGLRLVKKTVNFDDPYTYHFYYGDPNAAPGTILTFFPWENIPQGKPGAGMVTTVSFAVPQGSLAYWAERLAERRIDIEKERRFDELLLRFTDPHGLFLELIETNTPPLNVKVVPSPVPLQHAIIGFHSATAVVHPSSDPRDVLVNGLGMSLQAREGKRYRYRLHGDSAVGTTYDVVLDDRAAPGRAGGGTVHHIAFRARDDQEQIAWRQHLREKGFAVSPVRDRNYFHSIYFKTPGGVLFEIATDPPGFAVDEPLNQLGQSLKLPLQYEAIRADIEAHLPPLLNGDLKHLYILPNPGIGKTGVSG